MSHRIRASASLLLFILLLGAGCNSTTYKNVPPAGAVPGNASPTPTGSGAPVTFQQVNQGILQPSCVSCHSSGYPNFSSYSSFAQDPTLIVPGNPEQSQVYIQVQTGQMPQGGPPLNQATIDLIYQWIEQGAQP